MARWQTWVSETGDTTWAGHTAVERDGSARQRPVDGRSALAVAVGLAEFVARCWLRLVNVGLALVLAGALLVAYLGSIGLGWLAETFATAYLVFCLQRPDHSYFPFGYQMALEQRMVAMYGAQLLGGLAFGLVRARLRPLDWRLMIVLSLPLAWDGFSQVFGLRESDWLWRTWTGGLFSFALVWFAYPRLDRALAVLGGLDREVTA